MLGDFQQAALFCGPPRQPRSGARPSCRRHPSCTRPHSALPLPPPPATRLATVTPLSTRTATPLPQERPESLEKTFGSDDLFEIFDAVDTEKKGFLADCELQRLLDLLGVSYAPVQFMLLLSKLDSDGTGTVGREAIVNFFVTASLVKPCTIRPSGKACNPNDVAALPQSNVLEKESLHSINTVSPCTDDTSANSHEAMAAEMPSNAAEESKQALPKLLLVEKVHHCSPPASDDWQSTSSGADPHLCESGSKQCHERSCRRERRAQESIQRLLNPRHEEAAADSQMKDTAQKLPQTSERTSSAVKPCNQSLAAAWWGSTRLKHNRKTTCQISESGGLQSMPVVRDDSLGSRAPGSSSCSSLVSEPLCKETQDIVCKWHTEPKIEMQQLQGTDPATTPIVLHPRLSDAHTKTKRSSSKPAIVKLSSVAVQESAAVDVVLAKRGTVYTQDSRKSGKGGASSAVPSKRLSAAAGGRKKHSIAPRLSDNYSERKLHEFDVRQQSAGFSSVARGGRSHESGRGTYSAEPHEDGSGEPAAAEEVQVELGFHIIDWSSQSPNHEAISLLQPRGKWESLPTNGSAVHNEYVVLGLHGNPSSVTGIEITMNGTCTSPRRCRVQFSMERSGPWHEAWTFQVKPPTALTYRSQHEYGKLAREFKATIVDCCHSEEQAWDYMDCNSTGKLSKHDFESAFARMRKLCNSPVLNQMDPHQVFRDIDIDGRGELLLEDLFKDDKRAPVAGFWRLLIVDNYGSPSILLHYPLRIFSTEAAEMEMGNGIFEDQCKFLEERIMVSHPDCLRLTEEQRMNRRLAREHKVSEEESEIICREFHRFDTDGTNALEREEFDELVTKLQCIQGKSELPAKRLDFFWRQADSDQSGQLKLEEFFAWYSLHNRAVSED